jgi:hypothetical protein
MPFILPLSVHPWFTTEYHPRQPISNQSVRPSSGYMAAVTLASTRLFRQQTQLFAVLAGRTSTLSTPVPDMDF